MKHLFITIMVAMSLTGIGVTPALAEQVLVAVAANFLPPFRELAVEFEATTGHNVRVVAGSTGNFYAQIRNGAPFDIFFSADVERPTLLEEEGLALKGSRLTYAIGRLVLWSPDPSFVKGDSTLNSEYFKHLAIANPKTAPYGGAAMQTMQKLGLWEKLQPRIVMGENLGQTMGFIESGNAELGFVALSQVLDPKLKNKGSRWDVPTDLHQPIKQAVVLLEKGKANPAARAMLEFIRSPQAQAIIARYGYGLE
jgi:molybdate transport system substrate-binding protein